MLIIVFFFSSRRRHTRLTCDWSSDVCSSDLQALRDRGPGVLLRERRPALGPMGLEFDMTFEPAYGAAVAVAPGVLRSEERRVGKEGRSRWSPDHRRQRAEYEGCRGTDEMAAG